LLFGILVVFNTDTMQYIGVDIIEIDRIQKAIERWGEGFLKRIYSNNELELYKNSIPSLAARFAAKEAVMKALNVSKNFFHFRDVEILNASDGKPFIVLNGLAFKAAQMYKITELAISLSHSRNLAVAFVIGEHLKK
jgi:holo-[acyl-carrier protein] synthase